jgi:hypothetical protein
VAASLLLSAVLWVVFDWPVLFLAVPFVPFLFWRRDGHRDATVRHCPACEFRTRDPDVRYCPRDGQQLRERRSG